jgi:hypothetical protein
MAMYDATFHHQTKYYGIFGMISHANKVFLSDASEYLFDILISRDAKTPILISRICLDLRESTA